jgi:MFS family permease
VSTRTARPRMLTRPFRLIMLSTFAYFTALHMTIPVIPRFVVGPLDGGDVAVGLAVGAFTVTAIGLRPLAGRLGDRRGRRILMVGGASIVAISVAGLLAAGSLGAVIALRLLFGVGEGAFFVGAASAVNDLAPEERRGEATSLFSLALFGGAAVGPVLGETLLSVMSFSVVWAVAAGLHALAAVIALRMPDTRPPGHEVGRAVRLVHPAALMPGTVLAANVFALSAFIGFVTLYSLELGLPGARFVFLLNAAIVLGIRSFGARIPDVVGPARTAKVALSCSSLGLAVIALWGSVAGLFVGVAILAVGTALAFPALMTLAVRGAPAAERGSVVGTFSAFFDLSFGLGALSLGAISDAFGYRGAFASAALGGVAGLALLIARTRSTP